MRRTIAVAVMATLLLAACRGGPEPKEPDPTKSASPSISSTKPTPTPPTLPPQARKNTPEGAVAFVRHWINTLSFAINSNDVSALSRISNKDCSGCQSYIRRVEKAAAEGEQTRSFKWVPGRGSIAADRTVEIAVTATPFKFRESANAQWHSFDGERFNLVFTLKRSGSGWQVLRLHLPKAKQ